MEIIFTDIIKMNDEIKKRSNAGHSFDQADQPKRLMVGIRDCNTNETLMIRIGNLKKTLPKEEQARSAIEARLNSIRKQ